MFFFEFCLILQTGQTSFYLEPYPRAGCYLVTNSRTNSAGPDTPTKPTIEACLETCALIYPLGGKHNTSAKSQEGKAPKKACVAKIPFTTRINSAIITIHATYSCPTSSSHRTQTEIQTQVGKE